MLYRYKWILAGLVVLLYVSACSVNAEVPSTELLPPATLTATLSPTATPMPSPTVTVTPVPPTPTRTFTPSVTPSVTPLVDSLFDVYFHPDGGLYVGDLVSMEVIPLETMDLKQSSLAILVDGEQLALGEEEARFGHFGIGGRYQATLPWVWDTAGMNPGEHVVSFVIQPQGFQWEETVTLLPAEQLPFAEQGAQWRHTESACCLYYYISQTAAARDIEQIVATTENEANSVIAQLGGTFEQPVVLTLLPRVLGHGGFTTDEILISYLDRNYAGDGLPIVVHHEMVHLIDKQLEAELRPTIFVEGLAVYLTGGHFKEEPLLPRAAALLPVQEQENGLGWYLPLKPLADNFYKSQHEIGYLEAGALVEYMVERWGFEAFSDFYRHIQPVNGGSQSDAIDAALRQYFGVSFAELEAAFLQTLRDVQVSEVYALDVRLSIYFFDTVRAYQQLLDPSAYFLNAWIPNIKTMRESGIVADFMRHPAALENLVVETLLVSADTALREGDYYFAEQAINAGDAVVNAIRDGIVPPYAVHPLAQEYAQIIDVILDAGYTPERIRLDATSAEVIVTRNELQLETIYLEKTGFQWVLASN